VKFIFEIAKGAVEDNFDRCRLFDA